MTLATPRKVLLIDIDDVGRRFLDDAQLGGYAPNLARLRRAGIDFINFWAAHLCSPYRARCLTGQDAYRRSNRMGQLITETTTGEQAKNTMTGPWITDGMPGRKVKRGKWHLTGVGDFPAAVCGPGRFDEYSGSFANLNTNGGSNYFRWIRETAIRTGGTVATTAAVSQVFAVNDTATSVLADIVAGTEFIFASFNACHGPTFHRPPHNEPPTGTIELDPFDGSTFLTTDPWGTEPVLASGSITLSGAGPSDGDTVVVGWKTAASTTISVTFEFDSNGAVTAGNTPVAIGVSNAATAINLAAAINAQYDFSIVGTTGLGATGVLTFTGAGPSDTQIVTISDGVNVKVFEFDSNAAVTAGRVLVDISSGTAAGIATALITAINATPNFEVVAVTGGSGVVNLTNLRIGVIGNVAITETGSNLVVTSGMTGGLDANSTGTKVTLTDVAPKIVTSGAVAYHDPNVAITKAGAGSANITLVGMVGGVAGGTNVISQRQYYLAHLDYRIGPVIDAAIAAGYVVICASDNGSPGAGGKSSFFEAGLNTMLFVCGQGVNEAATDYVSNRLVNATDIWSTVRYLRGMDPGGSPDSFCFADEFLEACNEEFPERSYLTCDRFNGFQGGIGAGGAWGRTLRDRFWKLTDWPDADPQDNTAPEPKKGFYDLASDSTEVTNLLSATGSITFAGAPADGQTLTISDGVNIVTFEFDTNSAVTAGNVAVDISAASTDALRGEAMFDAIDNSILAILAEDLGTGVVTLENPAMPLTGNIPILGRASNTTVVGMTNARFTPQAAVAYARLTKALQALTY